RFDSVHGRFPREVKVVGDSISVGNGMIKVTAIKDPATLPWKELGIDIALECTGIFTSREKAAAHLTAGAKRVIISAPADGADLTVVYGVNHDKLTRDHKVVSNASCTTNCLAPVVKVLNDAVGIDKGFMTTVHSYTNDQPSLDQVHKDLYRARAAAINMIPTSTGAAKAVGSVLPELAGKLDGVAIRVPTPNVSVIDFKFVAKRATTKEEINSAVKRAAEQQLAARERLKRLVPVIADVPGRPVASAEDCIGGQAMAAVEAMRPGDVLCLENTRFHKGEERNDAEFVAQLAAVGDLFVNDAFSASHRAHASVEGLAHRLPAYAGRALQEEVEALAKILEAPARP